MFSGGNVRLICGFTGAILLSLLLLPNPSEMAEYWVGCSQGNFRPTDTCNRMCRLLGSTMTSCCYGVNHASRSACSCCNNTRACPDLCENNCVMVQVVAATCGSRNIPREWSFRDFPLLDDFEDLVPATSGLAQQVHNSEKQQQHQNLYMNTFYSMKNRPPGPSSSKFSSLGAFADILSPFRNGNENVENEEEK